MFSPAAVPHDTPKHNTFNSAMDDRTDFTSVPDLSDITKDQLVELMQLRGPNARTFVDQRFQDGITTLIRKLHTSSKTGVMNFEAALAHRRQVFGSNSVPPDPPRSFFKFLLYSMQDWILIVLFLGAIISLILGLVFPESCEHQAKMDVAWYEGLGILAMVIIMVLISALSDYLRDSDFRCQQWRVHKEQKLMVIRSNVGIVEEIMRSELTVGDLCVVEVGSVVPADGIVVQSSNLVVDEALFQSRGQLSKSPDSDLLLFAGTHVIEGSGKFIVLAVGQSTQANQIVAQHSGGDNSSDIELLPAPEPPINYKGSQNLLELKKHKEENATLEGKVNKVAIALGYVGIAIALITMIVIMIRFSVYTYSKEKLAFQPSHINEYIRAFIMGMVVLVISVPEGLPLVVTFSLAFCTKMMYSKNSLVRHMDIIETMGNVTNICCNKTGVLTEQRMHVAKMFIADQILQGDPRVDKHKVPSNLLHDMFKGISVNTSYTSQISPPGPDRLPVQVGNKTDCSLLQLMLEMGETYQYWRDDNPEDSFAKVFEFTSERKSMTTVLKGEKGGYQVYTKGAAEILLSHCKLTYTNDGSQREFTDHDRERVQNEVIKPMQEGMLRIICLASRILSESDDINLDAEDEVVSNLTLMAIIGIEDPIREEVSGAILKCNRAGIRVCMVSGDNIDTARAVAVRCGIVRPTEDNLMYSGEEFNSFIRDPNGEVNKDRFETMWPRLRVLARASARDKYTLVKHIMESRINRQGEIVAVTGSGVNDGPVLRKADVGFTMGVAGSDVAKENSDIILLDDNFGSIVHAIKWGRNVYDTVVKFLMFQFTVTWSAFIVIVIGACILGRSPLVATQMLWVNLIMDSLASLALTRDFPTDNLLRHQPCGKQKALIGRSLIRNVTGHVLYQVIVMFILIFLAPEFLDIKNGFLPETFCQPTQHSSLVFTTFVLMQLFNEINSRNVHGRNVFCGIQNNVVFMCIWLGQFNIQILIVEVFTRAFHTAGMDGQQWLWCLFLGFSELIWAQLIFTIPKTWLPLCMRCGIAGNPKGRRMNWIRSTSRVDQKDHGSAAAFKMTLASQPPPPVTPTGTLPISPENEAWRGPSAENLAEDKHI